MEGIEVNMKYLDNVKHNDQFLNIKIPMFNKKTLTIDFHWSLYGGKKLCMTVWKVDNRDVEDWCKLIFSKDILQFKTPIPPKI